VVELLIRKEGMTRAIAAHHRSDGFSDGCEAVAMPLAGISAKSSISPAISVDRMPWITDAGQGSSAELEP
jgi:hypothetical protein